MKHWIAVVSREHAQIAAHSGFLQVNHGQGGGGKDLWVLSPYQELARRIVAQGVVIVDSPGRCPRPAEPGGREGCGPL